MTAFFLLLQLLQQKFILMKVIFIVLRILTGVVFLFSAYVKLFPIELTEVAIVETGIIGWKLAPFAARLLVGFEFFLGIMLISGVYARFFIKLSLATLFAFTIYLILILIFQGNNTNCNCFGLIYAMTPVESIIKNLILGFVLAIILYFKRNKEKNRKICLLILILAAVISLIAVFVSAPIIIGTSRLQAIELNYEMDFGLIYNDAEADQPDVNLSEGKQIVVFLSSSCPHCVVAGYKFHVMKTRNELFPVYFFINGDEQDINDFHFKTKSDNIPYSNIKAGTLIALAGTSLPAIFWIDDGIVVNKQNYFEIDEKEIDEWLKE